MWAVKLLFMVAIGGGASQENIQILFTGPVELNICNTVSVSVAPIEVEVDRFSSDNTNSSVSAADQCKENGFCLRSGDHCNGSIGIVHITCEDHCVCCIPDTQGPKGTTCNTDLSKGELNDPCASLYNGVCGGKYCICPPNVYEDPGLHTCVPGASTAKPSTKPAVQPPPQPQPQPQPRPPSRGFWVGPRGLNCNTDPNKGELNDACAALYDGVCGGKYCICPPNMYEDPGLHICVPGAPTAKPSTKPAVQPPPQPQPQPQPSPPSQGFWVGPRDTTCNTDPSKGELNDPCASLYNGVCGGKYCICPSNMYEDSRLNTCVPGAPTAKSSGGVDLFDNLPFEYVPPGDRKPSTKPAVQPPPQPQPQPQTRPPSRGFWVGPKGTTCNTDPSKGELNDPCASLYNGVCGGKYCICPPNMYEDPRLNTCVPGAPTAKPSDGVDLFADLPLFYVPTGDRKPNTKPAVQPAPQPQHQPQPSPPSQGFWVGPRGTTCNTDPSKGELNDPCASLYDGVCGGKYCICPPNMYEDPVLHNCVPVECPTSQGFFRFPPGSRKCYRSFRDQGRTWPEAEVHCKTGGLQLPEEPEDAVGLRKHLVETYDLTEYAEPHWLGGRGSGGSGSRAIQWQRSGGVIPATSELWAPFQPADVSTDDCLMLGTAGYELRQWPEQPYGTWKCYKGLHTLCQVPMN